MLARVGATLAMIELVLATFLGARAADVGANAADFFREVRSTGHEGRRRVTNLRAITIKRDATGHHFDIVLLQTGAGAMFGLGGAVVAGFDTRLIFFVHNNSPVSLCSFDPC
jgi:hypothetical protein